MSAAAALIAWLEREGGTVAAVRVDGTGDARAVHADATLAAGALVLHVPRRLLVTTDVVTSSAVGRRIAASKVRLVSNQSVFAAWVLAERASPDSRFAPYLAALPATLGLRPAGFGAHTQALLRGTNALAVLAAQQQSIATDHAALAAAVPGFAAGVSLADFTWARLIVTSRVFALTIGGVSVDALVPVADLLDHAPTPATTWCYEDATAGFALRCAHACLPGASLTDSYGGKSNARFLVNYGFVLDDNPDDEAAVVLDYHRGAGDPRRLGLARALGDLALGSGSRYLVGAGGRGSERLLSALRLSAASDDELVAIADDAAAGKPTVAPLAPARERQVLCRLSTLIAAAVARFDQPLAADLAALTRTDWPPHVRACLVVRVGEQRILYGWAADVGAAIAAQRTSVRPTAPLLRACG